MPWYGWAVLVYIVLDRLMTVAYVGRKIEITPTVAVVNLITGGLIAWAVVSLV